MTSLRVTFAALLACASLTASAWWETQVVTNKWEYDGVEYLQGTGAKTNAYIDTGVIPAPVREYSLEMEYYLISPFSTTDCSVTMFGVFDGWAKNAFTFESRATSGSDQGFNLWGNTDSQVNNSNYNVSDTWNALKFYDGKIEVNGTVLGTSAGSSSATHSVYLFCVNNTGTSVHGFGTQKRCRVCKMYNNGELIRHFLPVLHEGEGKMLDLVHNTLYANAGTGAFTYGAVTGTVTYTQITTNRVYHANPPASAYDALSPWNAKERTRLGGDARTIRPSAIIKEN